MKQGLSNCRTWPCSSTVAIKDTVSWLMTCDAEVDWHYIPVHVVSVHLTKIQQKYILDTTVIITSVL